MATSIWQHTGDPSVYGFTEVDVTELKEKSMILPLVIKGLNYAILKNPELNSMIKWGRPVQRKDQMISVMVNIPGPQNDLSLINIDVSPDLSPEQVRQAVNHKSDLVRKLKDPHLGFALKVIDWLPQWLLNYFLNAYTFLIYELNTRLGITLLPLRPFGSIIVSNVGSLGINKALLPLVPLARASVMVSIGESTSEVKFHDGKIGVREIVHLGVTFDHRLFDGSHAAKMLNDFKTEFYSSLRKL